MTLQLEIPDAFASQLQLPEAELSRTVLESLAIQAFQRGQVSAFQVRNLLGHTSRWETQSFLSAHHVWPSLTSEEVIADAHTAAAFAMPS